MDIVNLPLIESNTDVSSAINRLRVEARSGLVVHEADDSHHLLYAGDLLRARVKGIHAVGQIVGTRPVVLIDRNWANKHDLDLDLDVDRFDLAQFSMFQSLHGMAKVNYALAARSREDLTIVTMGEWQLPMLTMTGGYRCNGTPTHYFPEPRVVIGAPCPLYPGCQIPGTNQRPVIQQA